jgi:hypothetical protein
MSAYGFSSRRGIDVGEVCDGHGDEVVTEERCSAYQALVGAIIEDVTGDLRRIGAGRARVQPGS